MQNSRSFGNIPPSEDFARKKSKFFHRSVFLSPLARPLRFFIRARRARRQISRTADTTAPESPLPYPGDGLFSSRSRSVFPLRQPVRVTRLMNKQYSPERLPSPIFYFLFPQNIRPSDDAGCSMNREMMPFRSLRERSGDSDKEIFQSMRRKMEIPLDKFISLIYN